MVKLTSPCTYQGGKQRLAKEITDYMLNSISDTDNYTIYDLCCGSGAITVELLNRGVAPNHIVMCDKSSWGLFWQAIGQGTYSLDKFYSYSKSVPRDKAQVQQHMKDLSKTDANIDEEYKYILLQAASFGGKQIWNTDGKWQNTSFRDYWQPTATSKRRSPVNPMQPMVDVIESRIEALIDNCKGLVCYHKDISAMIDIIANDDSEKIVYIDPPYAKTTRYGYSFDVISFINQLLVTTQATVLVSEKEPLSATAYKLNFSGDKGGISGNRKNKTEEWLSLFSSVDGN